MKTILLFLLVLGSLFVITGCANEPPAPKQDDRMGVRAGVGVSSHDMSRVVPSRPSVAPQN